MKQSMQLVDDLLAKLSKAPDILVVDDEHAITTAFRFLLEDIGCRVDTATDSQMAIDKIDYRAIKERPYDLVFLDLKLPPDHGPTVLKRIREVMPNTHVVVVTGYADSALVQDALKYGYLGLVKKPLDFEELKVIFSRHKINFRPHETTNNPT